MNFDVVLADPPWFYSKRKPYNKNGNRFGGGAAASYPMMKEGELVEMAPLIQPILNPSSILFLWVTFPELEQGLRIMRGWGFKYKTVGFCWTKTNSRNGKPFFGVGYYSKSNAEVCLLGTRGKGGMKPATNSVSSLIIEPRAREIAQKGVHIHSRKPEEAQNRIDLMYPHQNKLELFATREREGWVCLGNMINGADIRDELAKLGPKEEGGDANL